jgi:hypothetical protein
MFSRDQLKRAASLTEEDFVHLSPPIRRPERILMALAFWPNRSTL